VGRSAYRSLVLPILSRIEPERAHRAALRCLSVTQSTPGGLAILRRFAAPDDPRLRVRRFGLDFAHPIGAAAGMDKNGEAVGALLAIGFASVEVGTVTPRPQPGNPPPRVWRLRDEAALINRLGFPNDGARAVRRRLDKPLPGIVGVNVSKNRSTPASRAADDCAAALSTLAGAADYATLNVSSPNTPGLRDLQSRKAIAEILAAMKGRLPILVKLSPDLTDRELDEALAGIVDGGAAGVVISNTTTRSGRGGLSGPPLKPIALSLTRKVRRLCALPIIGVGGIATVEDVVERMKAGASLVQLYTAFVYEGPGLPGRLARGLIELMDREGVRRVEDLVGVTP
jgi:dihydroorotate dehydrogenase